MEVVQVEKTGLPEKVAVLDHTLAPLEAAEARELLLIMERLVQTIRGLTYDK